MDPAQGLIHQTKRTPTFRSGPGAPEEFGYYWTLSAVSSTTNDVCLLESSTPRK